LCFLPLSEDKSPHFLAPSLSPSPLTPPHLSQLLLRIYKFTTHTHTHTVTSPMPFPPGSLAELRPLAFHPVQLERVLGYSLYFALNLIPMLVVVGFPLAFLLHLPLLRSALAGAVMYCGVLLLSYRLLLRSQGWNKGDRAAYGGDSRNFQVIYCRNVRNIYFYVN
jgi:hypothetical protein